MTVTVAPEPLAAHRPPDIGPPGHRPPGIGPPITLCHEPLTYFTR